MKSVLISIRPKWCEKIASGEKTIEVRKTAPKEVPFKCYIYMSQGDLKDLGSYSEWIYKNRMKVIGEFVCDEVERFSVGSLRSDDIEKLACLSYSEMIDYFYKPEELDGKTTKQGLAWHISDLKIYDRPKELGEFKKTKEKIAMTCGMQARNGLCRAIDYEELCDNIKCCFKTPRPSQSWCYVEELKNEP